jgi:hypothetical protein
MARHYVVNSGNPFAEGGPSKKQTGASFTSGYTSLKYIFFLKI